MRNLFASLTSRLVLTVVALVVLVAVLIGVAATAALNAQLTHQLDDDLRSVAGVRPGRGLEGPGPGGPPPVGEGGLDLLGGGPQTVRAIVTDSGQSGKIYTGRNDSESLSDDVLDVLADVPADGEVHEVELPGLGGYRVIAVERSVGTEVTGLPTERSTAITR